MAIDVDDEILQDFLVEAGEILEKLGEQLVELEQRPGDSDLLNAVFRGFHTIKGGASFVSLTALVELCHRAEDVFNVLRNGERQVDAQLMDVVLPVLDVLGAMFESVRAGEEPTPAEPSLLAALEALSQPSAEPTPAAQAPAAAAPGDDQDITDAEFEALLDAAGQGPTAAAAPSAGAAGDEITEDEFEALLDQLHGQGTHVGAAQEETQPAAQPPATPAKAGADAAATDEITEDEFEALLDQLHGEGAVPNKAAAPAAISAAPAAKAQPAAQAAKIVAPPAAVKKPAKPDAAKEASQAETTVRVDTKRLDDMMNMVGELVLVRNRLATLRNAQADEELAKVVGNLDVVTADLQISVMKTRMQPIKKVFGRFPRVVRDLARNLNKDVNLELQGEETDLDKNLVEAIADPLVHLVRNAVDHGIESPEVREKAGKPRRGTVVLTADQEGDHILLCIEDDGAGMDPEVLRNMAIEKGIMSEDAAARLDEKECYNLIFAPGFSTKAEISDVSGRGVGMDVVKSRIVQLNGSVEIDSVKGKGSRISIKLPLTLAILPTLMIVLQNQTFAFPLMSVSEIFHLDLTKTNVVDGQLVVLVREKALPLFYLREWLIRGAQSRGEAGMGHVVVVNVGTQHVGFVVDQLLGQEEVVIKPLGAMLQGTKGIAGATITGDGHIALILDVPGLLKAYAHRC